MRCQRRHSRRLYAKRCKDLPKYLHFFWQGPKLPKATGICVLPERSRGISGGPYIFLHKHLMAVLHDMPNCTFFLIPCSIGVGRANPSPRRFHLASSIFPAKTTQSRRGTYLLYSRDGMKADPRSQNLEIQNYMINLLMRIHDVLMYLDIILNSNFMHFRWLQNGAVEPAFRALHRHTEAYQTDF